MQIEARAESVRGPEARLREIRRRLKAEGWRHLTAVACCCWLKARSMLAPGRPGRRAGGRAFARLGLAWAGAQKTRLSARHTHNENSFALLTRRQHSRCWPKLQEQSSENHNNIAKINLILSAPVLYLCELTRTPLFPPNKRPSEDHLLAATFTQMQPASLIVFCAS